MLFHMFKDRVPCELTYTVVAHKYMDDLITLPLILG